MIILTALLGAFGWRARGGLLKDIPQLPAWCKTTHFGRAVWAAIVALTYLAVTYEWLYSPLVFAFAFLGTLHGYWGEFDLLQKHNRKVKNYAKLTVMGMLRGAPLAFVFAMTTTPFFLPMMAGAAFVPCYLLGVVAWQVWGDKMKHPWHTQLGEALFGAVWLTAMVMGF